MKKKDFRLKIIAILLTANLLMILCLSLMVTVMTSKVDHLDMALSELSMSEITILKSDSEKIIAGASNQPAAFPETETVLEKTENGEAVNPDIPSDAGDTIQTALLDEPFAPDSYAAENLAISLKDPVDYSDAEVINQVWQLGQTSAIYAEMYENRDIYPYGMLKNMVNNPELTNYVYHFEGVTTEASAGLTDSEKNTRFPLFLQWDERWGYVSYGNNMIGVAGCGPTCLSMVLFSLTRDETLTPDYCADYSMKNGHYLAGTGTMWSLFEKAPQQFGVKSEKISTDKSLITDALNDGKMLVFSVGPGNFTAYGHFIVVYGMDEDGLLLINDPNSVYRSTRHWDFDSIKGQIKGVWTFQAE